MGNIGGTWMGDVCVTCCCMTCAIAQHLRQVRNGAAPKADHQAAINANQWSSGLFGCFDDCGSCMYGWCCLCCASASARCNYDGSNCFFNFFCPHTASVTEHHP